MSTDIHDECGVFAVVGADKAFLSTMLGLHALQHRGHESAGIHVYNDSILQQCGAYGCVMTGDLSVQHPVKGDFAIGHVRYSTSGSKESGGFQPIYFRIDGNSVSLAHNGSFTNVVELRKALTAQGCEFSTEMDSEIVLHLINVSKAERFIDKIKDALSRISGAYSILIMTDSEIYAVRDPMGIRPLVFGKNDDAIYVASETCALDIVGADYVRDISHGEIMIINRKDQSIRSDRLSHDVDADSRFCIFEYIYFARADSIVNNESVYDIRKKIGAVLAEEAHNDSDIVIPVPDSGFAAALGYAEKVNLPLEMGIVRNQYAGRTFIEPNNHMRIAGIKLKHNANRFIVKNKRVVLVDDSLVRGNTAWQIIKMLREAGAKEIHLRLAGPPVKYSCFYGIDTPTADELLANRRTSREMAEFLNVDSLAFVSLDGLYRAITGKNRNNNNPRYCDACFSGDYPVNPGN